MEGSMAVHIGLCVLPILYNFLIGHKLDITSFLCALPIVVRQSQQPSRMKLHRKKNFTSWLRDRASCASVVHKGE